MSTEVKVNIRNIRGEYRPLNLFKYFDDGFRKRLPKMIAKEFKDEIIQNIDSNRFKFHLSKRWQAYKKRVGADSRPFIMFGYYKNSITIVSSEGHISVGFKKTSMHPRAKVSMGKLAIQLEYGDLAKGIPARPLWRRSADSFFLERKETIGGLLKKSLK